MSEILQLRRQTKAYLGSFTGAVGEVLASTDTRELFVQDGSTAGGFPASGARGVYGASLSPEIIESSGAGGETLTTGASTFTTALHLPSGYKHILAAGWLVKTTVTGVTSIDFGTVSNPTFFASAQTPTSWAAGYGFLTSVNEAVYAGSEALVLTSHTGSNFTAGALRFFVVFLQLGFPTS